MTAEPAPADDADLPAPVPRAEPRAPRRWVRWAAAAVALVALGAGASAALAARGGEEPAPPPSGPRPVFALARLEPEGEVARVGGPSGSSGARIERLEVAVGDHVEAGQVLAVLDSAARLRASLAAAERQVVLARARLEQTAARVATEEVALRAALASARAREENAQVRVERQRALRARDAVSQQTLDDAELEQRVAARGAEEAAARLAGVLARVEGVQIDVRVAQEELAAAAAAAEEVRQRLEEAAVRAPRAGEVLQLTLRPGEQLGGQPLLDLGDTAVMWARAEVYESEVSSLEQGQTVHLSSSALERELEGTVQRIDRYVHRQALVEADPAAHTDARVVDVLVRLDPESSAVAARFVNLQVRARFAP